ncbi:autotransporter-associated beta strand repeat-containing protein, partial [Candidatus Pelagibacter bacterium]|nr:autotransporter-associated beta strand repeat-containing protein [Candidatus Pelagibacter bacterium]
MSYKNFISYFLIFFVSISSSNPIAFAGTVDALTLPTGGNVVTGSVSISQNNSGRMDVSQSSNQAIVNWDTFNVGSSASVHFNQPTSRSSILNNVLSGQSIINGSIFSNGQLILVNPTGILTGPTSAIRSEGAILSTLNLTNQNYLNKIYNFSASSNSNLLNEGKIEGEYIALLSPSITNKGTITTNVATSLAAGDDIRLSIGDTNLLTVSVNPSKIKSSINNEGNIKSQNGIVTLKTDIAQSVIDQVIKIENAKADGLISENGIVKLVANTGAITAKDIKIDAGSNGTSIISGILNSNSDTSNGGSVEVIAKEIDINAATISADGKTGGGKILIGGDWQGSGDLLQATYLNIDSNSKITANALTSGSGGTIVAWSDIKNSNSLTTVSGTLEAKGINGSGGQIETSGAELDINGIRVNTSSVSGSYGNWLVDPTDLTIGSSEASTYASNLASSDVTLTADNTITLDSAISYSGVRDSTLTFNATNTVLNANVTSSNGTLSLDFNSIVEIGDANTTLTTNGGNVDISGVIRAVTAETNNFTINAGAGNVTFSSNLNSTPGNAATYTYLTSSTHTTTQNGSNPYTISLDLGSDWTYEAKYNSSGWSGNLNTIFSYGRYNEGILVRSPNRGDSFYVRGQNQGQLDLFGQGSSGTAGAWRTVKIVYNSNIAKVYVDGSLATNGTNSRSSGSVINPTTKTIMIGKAHHAGNEGLAATIKDITIVTDASSPNSMINNLTVTANQFNAQAIALDGTLSVTNSGDSTISGVISGNTALTKAGTGTLILSGSNTYTGNTTISAGTLDIQERMGITYADYRDSVAAASSYAGNHYAYDYQGDIVNNGVLKFSDTTYNPWTDAEPGANTSQYFTGDISGSGSLVMSGRDLLGLKGNNTYSGGTIINNGSVFSESSVLSRQFVGSGSVTINNGGTLRVDRSNSGAFDNEIVLNGGTFQGSNGFGANWDGNISVSANSTIIATVNNNLNLLGVISGSGGITKSGSGTLTLSGSNSFTSSVNITAGTLSAANNNSLGSTPNLISSSGTFKTTSGVVLPSLTISGAITLSSGIVSTGAQIYNNNVVVKAGSRATPAEISTTNSDISFEGTLKGEGNAKARSLNIDAGTGNVLFGDRVGYAFNDEVVNINNTADSFYKLVVDANEITIKGDVMTYEEQIYNGDVLIGSTATNGTTRTFLSMDPKVEFNGTVNDTVKGKHTLIAKAIEIDRGANSIPVVNFNSTVGRSVALASYNGLTGYQVINRN